MVHEITVLVVPPGESRPYTNDPRIDEVEVDPEAERPYIDTRVVSDEGSTAVDRALVTDYRKRDIADAILEYQEETSKDTPDTQVQLAALEKAITLMWDVVSGEDVGSANPEQP
ncbi:hypothetical protein [Haloferax larsenii]|uniref:Uncharacterized protein n=1 Tax=Haloferax larsenii TaxID=302484 RepID=A0A1H7N1M8_HALLR|nr:hypothetical protein [Haloferax larsenii]SEL16918.1 hypothetical protein SAMN04488691_103154 [Haloferax larsenii]